MESARVFGLSLWEAGEGGNSASSTAPLMNDLPLWVFALIVTIKKIYFIQSVAIFLVRDAHRVLRIVIKNS